MKKIFQILVLAAIIAAAAPAFAKDESGALQKGDIGLNFFTSVIYSEDYSYNQASYLRQLGAGAIYHAASSFALEPGISFLISDIDENDNLNNNSGIKNVFDIAPSIGAFYYSNIRNKMYLYTGPRFEYSYYKYKSETGGTGSDYDRRIHTMVVSAVFGLKYMIGDRLGIFSDVGLGLAYSHNREKQWNSSGTLVADDTYKTKTLTIARGNIGLAFYF